jgi:hypothetical protein
MQGIRADVYNNILAKVKPILGEGVEISPQEGQEDWFVVDAKRTMSPKEIVTVSKQFKMCESPAETNLGREDGTILCVYYPLNYNCKLCGEHFGELKDTVIHVYRTHGDKMSADQKATVEKDFPEALQ